MGVLSKAIHFLAFAEIGVDFLSVILCFGSSVGLVDVVKATFQRSD